jgi:hypothetical protein
MAILSFAMTKNEFLEGNKTVTRRSWNNRHFEMWARFWDTDRHVHDAWDNIPRVGGRKIGEFRLTERPYREKLKNMPRADLVAEGGMCSSLDEFYNLINKTSEECVTVVRFEKL